MCASQRSLGFPFPAKLPVNFPNGDVVNAGEAAVHIAKFIKFPVLVAVGAIPLAGVVVKFIFEAHGNAVAGERPEFLLQAIVQFPFPFALQEFDDLGAAIYKLGTIAPFGVFGVGERDALGVASVPGIFGSLNLLARGLFGKRWQWRARVHRSVLDFELSFEFGDALFQWCDCFFHFGGSIAGRDVFWTVPIKRDDIDEE